MNGPVIRIVLSISALAGFVLAAAAVVGTAKELDPRYAAPGAAEVGSLKFDWLDAARQRVVPVKLYFPKSGAGPFPVIVFSHGLGGTREGYAYLGQHWASHGYVVVHLQHLGSDDSVWRGSSNPKAALDNAAASLTNALSRPLDVRFALDGIAALNRTNATLRGRLDTQRMGIAGHSFGAHTTLVSVGQKLGLGWQKFSDDRLKAAIAMSAPVPVRVTADTYAGIRVPVYHLTGTRDSSPVGSTTIAQRRVPFDRMANSEELLLTLRDGDHMIFSGRGGAGRDDARDERQHALILASTTAFWDAWLKQDAPTRAWLMEGGFAAALDGDGVFEHKEPAQAGAK